MSLHVCKSISTRLECILEQICIDENWEWKALIWKHSRMRNACENMSVRIWVWHRKELVSSGLSDQPEGRIGLFYKHEPKQHHTRHN